MATGRGARADGPVDGPAGCPPPATLLRHVLADGVETPDGVETADGSVARHLEACDTCQAMMTTLRDTVNALRSDVGRAEERAPGCLDEDAIAAFVAGSGSLEDERRIVSHLMTCRRCCRATSSVARAMRDPAVAAELARLAPVAENPRRRWAARVAITAALAAAAAFVVVRRADDFGRAAEEPAYREQSSSAGAAPIAITPVGRVPAADTLRWRSVPNADLYQVTVFSATGDVIWRTQTRDTAAVLPREIARTLRGSHVWKVAARTGWNRWVESDLIQFTLRGPP